MALPATIQTAIQYAKKNKTTVALAAVTIVALLCLVQGPGSGSPRSQGPASPGSAAASGVFSDIKRFFAPAPPEPVVWVFPEEAEGAKQPWSVPQEYTHDARSYARLEGLYDALDNFTIADEKKYGEEIHDRLWSIASIQLYNQTKTQFVFDRLRAMPQDPPPTICELGFNGGHSALTFLESMPTAKVISFDLGDVPWSQRNSKHLEELYKPRFQYIKGDSRKTVPKMHGTGLDCDVLLIDGSKNPDIREHDLAAFRQVSHKGAKLFLDECNNFPCVSAELDSTDPACNKGLYWKESRLYNKLVKMGILRVFDCSNSPFAEDNLCFAEFAK